MGFDWENHRPLIERLVRGKNHTLKEIVAEVRKKDPSFTARQANFLQQGNGTVVDSV
jgi:hypothetical protein